MILGQFSHFYINVNIITIMIHLGVTSFNYSRILQIVSSPKLEMPRIRLESFKPLTISRIFQFVCKNSFL
ncbi:hypothetical protein AOA60_00015, partial [Pseudomonas sp. 2822-17]